MNKHDLLISREKFQALGVTPTGISLLAYFCFKQTHFQARKPDMIAKQAGFFYLYHQEISAECWGISQYRVRVLCQKLESLHLLETKTEPYHKGGRRKYFKVNFDALDDLQRLPLADFCQKYQIQSIRSKETKINPTSRKNSTSEKQAQQITMLLDEFQRLRAEVEELKRENAELKSAISETQNFTSERKNFTSDLLLNRSHYTHKEEINFIDPASAQFSQSEGVCNVLKDEKGLHTIAANPISYEKFSELEERTQIEVNLHDLNQDLRQHGEPLITQQQLLKSVAWRHDVPQPEIHKAFWEVKAKYPGKIKKSIFALFVANTEQRVFKDRQCVFSPEYQDRSVDPIWGQIREKLQEREEQNRQQADEIVSRAEWLAAQPKLQPIKEVNEYDFLVLNEKLKRKQALNQV
jgi:hypothetical protein